MYILSVIVACIKVFGRNWDRNATTSRRRNLRIFLPQSDIKKLEAAEMWFLRRMQKISWKEKKSNEEIVKSTIGSRNLLAKVMQRQTSFFGHIMRKQGIEQVVTTCKIDGKRKRGRRPTQFLDQIMRWTNSQSVADVMNRVRSRTLTVAKVF